ncbi:Gos1p [Lachancea thermotolerans CBS 6340]|uniref:Golgi SNAP receptor complex member 1 n=1 Tax=Lachancea thermotolerans (strain ATCC 56472 / CBS 6340 / NRRL Y-8284) TaxID=559295 RepID=C5DHN1_LACTC|nr:KLTH0E05698p [Lachancea thermotolerans CBS 6340]CAR23292.1 KLTH0E05698p [Lachancea thermotolerans CBS 6340]
MASFVTVRGQAISLESQTESLLSKFSQYAQTTSSEPTSQERNLDSKLDSLLTQRQEVVDSLSNICNENPSISASKLSQLQRHREILQEHWQHFRNLRSSIQQERNRLNLLFSVKKDIAQQSEQDQDKYIQDEARRIDESHNVVDSLVSQAWDTRDQFSSQRTVLQTANNRMMQTLQRVPGINQVIAKINTRRKKNAVILASLITLCILFLFFTW